ncbi:hypothetical protein IT400_02885 [Candidatus Nomurabacteria bacterium]|nr:hypothetical protein [Candidatus Nomurabacteria bacterium]
MIVRTVKVNRNQSPQQMLDATGRKQYTNKSVVAGIPKGKGAKKQVYFFKVSRYITEEELEKEYKLRGLEPDVYAQAKANQDDPAFADTHPNCTHWKDENGNWNFSAFDRNSDERDVLVICYDNVWDDNWWFGGVRE